MSTTMLILITTVVGLFFYVAGWIMSGREIRQINENEKEERMSTREKVFLMSHYSLEIYYKAQIYENMILKSVIETDECLKSKLLVDAATHKVKMDNRKEEIHQWMRIHFPDKLETLNETPEQDNK